jgi:hypothetical protein
LLPLELYNEIALRLSKGSLNRDSKSILYVHEMLGRKILYKLKPAFTVTSVEYNNLIIALKAFLKRE